MSRPPLLDQGGELSRFNHRGMVRAAGLRKIVHGIHALRLLVLQKLPRRHTIKPWVRYLDAEEESVLGHSIESRFVEQRMMRLRKPIHGKHSKDARQPTDQNRQLESDH